MRKSRPRYARRTRRLDASVRVVFMLKAPKDAAAFDEHYFGTQMPPARLLPGLRKYEIDQGSNAMPFGRTGLHPVATFHCDDAEGPMWLSPARRGWPRRRIDGFSTTMATRLCFLLKTMKCKVRVASGSTSNPAGLANHLVS